MKPRKNNIIKILIIFSFICVSCDIEKEMYYYDVLPDDSDVENIHVFLIGLDGWGGYSFANKDFNMPTITELMDNGCYTLQALNVKPTISLPNWSSMFMGTSPNLTGYKSNRSSSAKSKFVDIYGLFPSIFILLKEQRPQCKVAYFYEWRENGYLCPDNVIDEKHHYNLSNDISAVTEYIKTERPNFCAIVIDEPDGTGEKKGFNSPDYYAELTRLDGLITQIIQTIKEAGIYDNSVIILSADHGGVNRGHGGNSDMEKEIPVIFVGNNIKKEAISQQVMIYDIAPTIAKIFKLETPSFWEGKLINVFKE
jgi:predicted AlkP superfamily pyrophosphatase or phosphodiesterase